ncbi:MAG: hypothetical protein R3B90_01085 [Planctomycetaceae bacterium]
MRNPLTQLAGAGHAEAETAVTLIDEARELAPQWEQQRARGIMFARRAEQTSDVLLADQAINALRPLAVPLANDLPLQAALAAALNLTGDTGGAGAVWQGILQQDPSHEAALEGLAYACHDAGQFELALEYLDRLLAINPYQSNSHGRRAHILGRLERMPEAIEAAQRTIELDPTSVHVYRWLSHACALAGDQESSQKYSNMADTLERLPPVER